MAKIKVLVIFLTVFGLVSLTGQVRSEKVGGVDVIIKSTEGCVDRCPQETPALRLDRLEVQIPRRKKRITETDRAVKNSTGEKLSDELDD